MRYPGVPKWRQMSEPFSTMLSGGYPRITSDYTYTIIMHEHGPRNFWRVILDLNPKP